MTIRPNPIITILTVTLSSALLVSACASLGGRKSGGKRPSVALAAAPTCTSADERKETDKSKRGPQMLPDEQFCGAVAQAVKAALAKAGFDVTDGEEAPLLLKLSGSQKARIGDDGDGGTMAMVHVALHVVIDAKGQEPEKLHTEGDVKKDFKEFLSDAARDLVSELTASPKLKDAGLTPG